MPFIKQATKDPYIQMQFVVPYETSQGSSIAMCCIEVKTSQAKKLQKLFNKGQKEQATCGLRSIAIPTDTRVIIDKGFTPSDSSATCKTVNFFQRAFAYKRLR